MTQFLNLPDDDRFWAVTWIDRVTLPYATTRSPAVSVLLREVPITDRSQLDRLTQAWVRQWLRSAPNANAGGDAPAVSQPHIDPTAKILIGTLPMVGIGSVFHRQSLVGRLPSEQVTFEIRQDDHPAGLQRTLDELIAPPADWDTTYPYRILNPSEMAWVKYYYPGSRYLLVPHPTKNIDYIIPRTEIFRRFYGPHTELAKAFTAGPWHLTQERVICEADFESGLKTQLDPATGEYHIIVEMRVPTVYGRWLAFYRFDEYAIACANMIFGVAWQDASVGKGDRGVYLAARIPFRASASQPLKVRARGWMLPMSERARANGRREKFLVTSLISCSEPRNMPQIWCERRNSGRQSENPIFIPDQAPYVRCKTSKPAPSNLAITSLRDADDQKTSALEQRDSFFFTDAKPLRMLTKESHKVFTGKRPAPSEESTPDVGSTGELTAEGDLPAPVRISSIARPSVNRFLHLYDSFTSMVSGGYLLEHTVEAPQDVWQLINRGEIDCWSFLTQDQAESGIWPSRAWVMIEPAHGKGANRYPGTPRSAYVARLVGSQATAYWIEIESRTAERSAESFTAVILVDVVGDPQEVVRAAIACIIAVEGRNLSENLQGAVGASCRIHTVFHRYASETEARLTDTCVINALVRSGISSPKAQLH